MKKGYWKGFIEGKHGHSHGAVEGSVWLLAVGLGGWLNVWFGLASLVVLLLLADKFWFKREQRQAKARGRATTWRDFVLDAKEDVLFPRRMRVLWLFAGLAWLGVLARNLTWQ